VAFGMRKALQTEAGKSELETQVESLQDEKKELERQVGGAVGYCIAGLDRHMVAIWLPSSRQMLAQATTCSGPSWAARQQQPGVSLVCAVALVHPTPHLCQTICARYAWCSMPTCCLHARPCSGGGVAAQGGAGGEARGGAA
jgi:hypothetical protein